MKHQAVVGAGYFDEIIRIYGETSTQTLHESTEQENFRATLGG